MVHLVAVAVKTHNMYMFGYENLYMYFTHLF